MKVFILASLTAYAALTLQGCSSDFVHWASDPQGYYAAKEQAEMAKKGIYLDKNGRVQALVIDGRVYTAAPSGSPVNDDADANSNAAPNRVYGGTSTGYGAVPNMMGQPVYRADDCIGAVVNGVCHGAISPRGQIEQPTRCYGQMLNGQCTGPQF